MSYAYGTALVIALLGFASLARGIWLDRKARGQEHASNDDVYAPVLPILVGLVLLALALVLAVVTFIASGLAGL